MSPPLIDLDAQLRRDLADCCPSCKVSKGDSISVSAKCIDEIALSRVGRALSNDERVQVVHQVAQKVLIDIYDAIGDYFSDC